jgi:hypothetical protein
MHHARKQVSLQGGCTAAVSLLLPTASIAWQESAPASLLLLLLLWAQQQCIHELQLLCQVGRHSPPLKVPPAPRDLDL